RAEQHQPHRQQCYGPPVGLQVLDRRVPARSRDQRREEDQEDEGGREGDRGKARDEAEHEAAENEGERGGQGQPGSEQGQHRDGHHQAEDELYCGHPSVNAGASGPAVGAKRPYAAVSGLPARSLLPASTSCWARDRVSPVTWAMVAYDAPSSWMASAASARIWPALLAPCSYLPCSSVARA